MKESKLKTGRGERLPAYLWTSDADPVGVVTIVHGLGDHAERYRGLANDLASAGWATFAFDLPGHGDSPGRRGATDSFDGLLKDVDSALSDAVSQFRSPPLSVVLGHSMGGNLALNYALRHQAESQSTVELAGLVLAAPMLLPPRPPPRPQIFAAWLTGHLLPWLRVHSKVDASRLTSDPQQAELITGDSKMHGSISIYLATQLLSQGRWAMDHARELSIPTLLMFGDDDDLIDRAACDHLPIRAGHVVDAEVLKGKRHAIFHDQPAGEVSQRLIDWLGRLSEDV